MRVLVVDDNVDWAKAVAMLLEMSGHEVQIAHEGIAALKTALDYRPDVVLMDIGLPGMSGYEVAKRLASASRFSPGAADCHERLRTRI